MTSFTSTHPQYRATMRRRINYLVSIISSLFLLTSLMIVGGVNGQNSPTLNLTEYLQSANEEYRKQNNVLNNASWEQASNITDANEEAYSKASAAFDEFRKTQSQKARSYAENITASFTNTTEQRLLEKIIVIDTSALDTNDSKTFFNAQQNMTTIYSVATIDACNGINLELEPDLTQLLATSTNETCLREIWTKWRNATGAKMRNDYITYYTLGNKAATLNKLPSTLSNKTFKTFDDLWMFEWENDANNDLRKQIGALMNQTMEIYVKIHAYVRYFLLQKYDSTVMPHDGTIPAHLLGNMWAQQWSELLNTIPEMNPSPDVTSIDSNVNEKLKSWNITQMFKLSETFFRDLGMQNMTQTFWNKSIIEKPTDRNLTCHASAWDFFDSDSQDFRIKMCTVKDINDLITIHHEMGHVQYYMNYREQPTLFRSGANPGFHEAIGDLIALSVATPKHLAKVNLFTLPQNETELKNINLNYQLKMALEKIVFLPFSYVMDRWRWDVFGGGEQMKKNLNRHWWELRLQYQGVSPPVNRSEQDFDPGAKYHIPAGVEYVRYFAAHVLQFQFYERMCALANANTSAEVLYQCDFDGNKEAGAKLMKMLATGSSEPWPTVLNSFVNQSQMNLDSLLKYFTPLTNYLDTFLAEKNITTGWTYNVDDYMISDGGTNSGAFSQVIMANSWLLLGACLLVTILSLSSS